MGKLARRSVQNIENTVQILRYNNHICYIDNISAVFQLFSWTNCDTFFQTTFKFEQKLTACSVWVKHVDPRSVYKNREFPIDKLFFFLWIKYTSVEKIFKNSATLDFKSTSVQEETFTDTNTITWIRKTWPDICILFFKFCGRTSFPLQLWSSSRRCIF